MRVLLTKALAVVLVALVAVVALSIVSWVSLRGAGMSLEVVERECRLLPSDGSLRAGLGSDWQQVDPPLLGKEGELSLRLQGTSASDAVAVLTLVSPTTPTTTARDARKTVTFSLAEPRPSRALNLFCHRATGECHVHELVTVHGGRQEVYRLGIVRVHRSKIGRLYLAIGLLAMGALTVAGEKLRRGAAYVRKLSGWSEATLGAEDRVEASDAALLGVLASPRSLDPGPVLVAPAITRQAASYRDLAVIARNQIVAGTHATWERGTMRRLRDALTLALVSTICSALALAAALFAR